MNTKKQRTNLTEREKEALRCIRNAVVHYGKFPSSRELMRCLGYKSPRSALLIVSRLHKKGFLKKDIKEAFKLIEGFEGANIRANTVDIPLVGQVSAGTPTLAEENIETRIPVSREWIQPNQTHFLLRVSGDSMDKAGMNDGDLVLVRQQPTAENNEKVVALIDSEATVKEYMHMGDKIILSPKSTNPAHKPIVLQEDFIIQGVVVTVIPKFEF